MVDIDTLEGEWQDLAIDDGDIVLTANEYFAELDDGSNVISTRITSISYSPTVNKAKNLKIDVPPTSDLEDNTYLGETLRVYVDDSLLFEGDIVTISTSQTEGDDYTVEAESPGKRLKGDDIDRTVSNELVYDTISSVIDGFNELDGNYRNLQGTDDEERQDVKDLGQNVLTSSDVETTGAVTYPFLGINASDIETIYVKSYTPGSDDSIIVDVLGAEQHSYTIDDADGSRYGEWNKIKPDISDISQYDFKIRMKNDARLIDWVVITNHQIRRKTYTPDISEDSSPEAGVGESDFYTFDTDEELVKNTQNSGDAYIVTDEEGSYEIRTRKVSAWGIIDYQGDPYSTSDIPAEEQGNFQLNDEDAIAGQELVLEKGERSPDLSNLFFVRDTLVDYEMNIRLRVTEDTNTDPDVNPNWRFSLELNGETNDRISIGNAVFETETDWPYSKDHGWLNFRDTGVREGDLDSVDSLVIKTLSDSELHVAIDAIVFTHKGEQLNYTFSDDTDSNNQLARPASYAHNGLYDSNQYVEFQAQQSDKNISSATSTISVSSSQNTASEWGVEQSVTLTPGVGYTSFVDSTNTVSDSFAYPGVSHSIRVMLAGIADDTETPKEGHDEMVLNSISADISTNDADIVTDEGLSGNRLSVINSLAKDSSALFRFDGNKAKIFQQGLLKTDVDLYKESVTSSRDISETYKSCQVKGKNDVKGNRVVAPNAPSFVDKDKSIIDRGVESKEQATSKARSFLKDHGEIEYKGDISTLPTMAPIGEMMDGSIFAHGQDMVIEGVRYSKNRTSISLGFDEDVASQLIENAREARNINQEGASKGMTVPTGEDEFSEWGGS
jgi:hypothetical protein